MVSKPKGDAVMKSSAFAEAAASLTYKNIDNWGQREVRIGGAWFHFQPIVVVSRQILDCCLQLQLLIAYADQDSTCLRVSHTHGSC